MSRDSRRRRRGARAKGFVGHNAIDPYAPPRAPEQSPPPRSLPRAVRGVVRGSLEREAPSDVDAQVFLEELGSPVMEDNPNQADGPDRAFVTIPQCASGPEASCPLERFRQLVLSAIKAECVSTVPVDAL